MLAWLKGRDVLIKTKTVAHLYSEFLKKQFLSTFGFIDEEILQRIFECLIFCGKQQEMFSFLLLLLFFKALSLKSALKIHILLQRPPLEQCLFITAILVSSTSTALPQPAKEFFQQRFSKRSHKYYNCLFGYTQPVESCILYITWDFQTGKMDQHLSYKLTGGTGSRSRYCALLFSNINHKTTIKRWDTDLTEQASLMDSKVVGYFTGW